jgi:hypothetical protein
VIRVPEGMGLVALFTTDAAVDAFCKHHRFGGAIVQAGLGWFDLGEAPMDGIIVNPYGPGTRRILSREECEWIFSGAPLPNP